MKWIYDEAIDHNVHPHRVRWTIFDADTDEIITILDDKAHAELICRAANSIEWDKLQVAIALAEKDG